MLKQLNSEFVSSVRYYSSSILKRNTLQLGLPNFIDFDANLLHKDLKLDIEIHIQNGIKNGINYFVVPGSDLIDSQKSLELSRNKSVVIATAGIHPYQTENVTFSSNTLLNLENLILDANCRSVGETGLDFSPGFPARDFQIEWFAAHVDLACRNQKPLYLHVRNAHDDFVNILSRFGFTPGTAASPPVAGCVHCFTGTFTELQVYLSLGLTIGLTGFIFSLPDQELQRWLREITLERLVLETDCPYMGFKGCRATEQTKKGAKYPNVPSSLLAVAGRIAAVAGWDLAAVAAHTSANALRFFGLQERDLAAAP